jgi:aryl-alcohol dehydrogenase-like predicted oxidoreductase
LAKAHGPDKMRQPHSPPDRNNTLAEPDTKSLAKAPALRALGRTGLRVSQLGFGCSGYWAQPFFSERRAYGLVEQALDGGITVFDTGPVYGVGRGERRLGRVLRSRGTARDLVVCGKAGTHVADDGFVFRDFSPEAVRTSVARSLERLGLDRLDGLHLHGPNLDELRSPLLETLEDLKTEGLVGFVGVNSFDPEVVRAGLATGLFDSFMIEYNLIHKANAALLEEISRAGAAAIIGAPLAQTLFRPSLWPTSPKRAWELARALARHRESLRAARAYRFLNGLTDMTGAQAALAYVLRAPQVATAVFATTSPEHLRQNIAAARLTLSDELIGRIEALPDAPRAR